MSNLSKYSIFDKGNIYFKNLKFWRKSQIKKNIFFVDKNSNANFLIIFLWKLLYMFNFDISNYFEKFPQTYKLSETLKILTIKLWN